MTIKDQIAARNKVVMDCEARWSAGKNCRGCRFCRDGGCSQSDVIDGILKCDMITNPSQSESYLFLTSQEI